MAPQTRTEALAILGINGSGDVEFLPLASGAVRVRQCGQNAAIAPGTIVTVDLPQSMSVPLGVNLTTWGSGGSGDNAMAQLVTGSLTSTQFQVKMQNISGSGGPSQPFSWEAFGYQ
jgi:ABC-type uncharacterized transport system ATPase component